MTRTTNMDIHNIDVRECSNVLLHSPLLLLGVCYDLEALSGAGGSYLRGAGGTRWSTVGSCQFGG